MIVVAPVVLEGGGIRLEPLTDEHHDALAAAAADGRLWELWFIAVPPREGMRAYVAEALKGQRGGAGREPGRRDPPLPGSPRRQRA